MGRNAQRRREPNPRDGGGTAPIIRGDRLSIGELRDDAGPVRVIVQTFAPAGDSIAVALTADETIRVIQSLQRSAARCFDSARSRGDDSAHG